MRHQSPPVWVNAQATQMTVEPCYEGRLEVRAPGEAAYSVLSRHLCGITDNNKESEMKSAFCVDGPDGRVIGYATGCDYLLPADVQSDELIVRQSDIGSLDAPRWIPAGSVRAMEFPNSRSIQSSFAGRQ
jgi:hypothetical protein